MTPRIRNLARRIGPLEADALLVTDETNVRYLSGFTGDSSSLLVAPGDAWLLTDGRYESQVKLECPGMNTLVRSPAERPDEFLAAAIRDSGYRRIGFEADHVSVAQFSAWGQRSEPIRWVATSGEVERLRQIKDDDELATLREAVRIAQRAFRAVTATLTAKSEERQIAHGLEASMRSLGAEGVSFEPIVAAGPAAAWPHYRPGATAIGDSPTLLIDWGARFQGYCSDLTRTLVHRPQAPAAFLTAYEVVLEAQLAAIESIGPGVEARRVDAAARGIIERAGLGPEFKHGLGHGIGLQIHEDPRMSAASTEVLRPGMVVTVEPGVYLENRFGIRLEDDVLVTETGRELLSDLPKGLVDVDLIR